MTLNTYGKSIIDQKRIDELHDAITTFSVPADDQINLHDFVTLIDMVDVDTTISEMLYNAYKLGYWKASRATKE